MEIVNGACTLGTESKSYREDLFRSFHGSNYENANYNHITTATTPRGFMEGHGIKGDSPLAQASRQATADTFTSNLESIKAGEIAKKAAGAGDTVTFTKAETEKMMNEAVSRTNSQISKGMKNKAETIQEAATEAAKGDKKGLFSRLGSWIKNNKGKAALIGVAVAGAITAAVVLIKKHMDKKAEETTAAEQNATVATTQN